jgi:hypothetical protein
MSNQEKESMSVTEGHRKPLPTASGLGLNTKPCDICGSTRTPVRFWGATSVLVCGGSACDIEMQSRWDECMADNRRETNRYNDDY